MNSPRFSATARIFTSTVPGRGSVGELAATRAAALGGSALPALDQLETEGLGPGRPDGWGRLVACHPLHVDHAKEVKA